MKSQHNTSPSLPAGTTVGHFNRVPVVVRPDFWPIPLLVTAPPADTPEYGQYLVDVIGCRDCHGSQLEGKAPSGQPGPLPSPNLTQIVPQWTEAEFMTFFNTGALPGGGTVPLVTLKSGFSEPKMPWPTVRAATTDDELRAMYSYLHSLPPIEGSTQ